MIGQSTWVELVYVVAALLFLFGIKRLGSPATARSGNTLGWTGMALAVVVTLIDKSGLNVWLIFAGIAVGAVIGTLLALRVQMTAMPQLVALFNGLGGGASTLIAAAEFARFIAAKSAAEQSLLGQAVPELAANVGLIPELSTTVAVSMGLSVAIGAITLSGSVVAFAKLQGLIQGRPIVYAFQQESNMIMAALTVLFTILLVFWPHPVLFVLLTLLPLVVGVTAVIRIGGADMPVVISLLNSLSGVAAAAAGFVIGNSILVVGGTIVGAAGLILTQIMSRAMNRSLGNVLFGAFGAAEQGGDEDGEEKIVRSVSAEEAAMVLGFAESVIVVPGYGLAVAQAQHNLAELAGLLEGRRATVKYAIHPVAGRMPGHMNVLLAEANVPYDRLYDLDDINAEFERTDVVIVVGANDVTNPQARTDPDSPLYGMPILDVDKARSVLVLKRGMSPGFSGVDNPLFYDEKTMMLFGDAKDSIVALTNEVKDL